MTDGTQLPPDMLHPVETGIPAHIFINLDRKLAPALYTIPRGANPTGLENVTFTPDSSPQKIVVTLENNGKYKPKKYNPNDFDVSDWSIKTPIVSAQKDQATLTYDQIEANRTQLLDEHLTGSMGPEEKEIAIKSWEQAGLREGAYLYRAFTTDDMDKLQRERFLNVHPRDHWANFETQDQYESDRSQVKSFATKTDKGYSGNIIRWKIAHPLLYRISGMTNPYVIPNAPHYLPEDIEISVDGGKTFANYDEYRNSESKQ